MRGPCLRALLGVALLAYLGESILIRRIAAMPRQAKGLTWNVFRRICIFPKATCPFDESYRRSAACDASSLSHHLLSAAPPLCRERPG